MSLFITFEGCEGCGKSTQAKFLYQRLKRRKIPAVFINEPGVTVLGKKLTRLLKWSHDINITPLAELLLFNVSRAQLVTEVIQPNLKNNINVICDRYSDSTSAYQGYGRGLDLSIVKKANEIAMQGIIPDITYLLDIPIKKGLERKQDNKADRFETEDLKFHDRVREGYLLLAKAEPERWLVINANQSKKEIAEIIWQRLSSLLTK